MNPEAEHELAKLAMLHQKATHVLYKCHAVFPFDFFPNGLIIDANKVDLIYRSFFRSSETISVPISRIGHVTIDSVFFLSTLKIDNKSMEKNPRPLIFLKTKDAIRAKNLIFGLMSAEANGIDLSQLADADIMEKLIEIGQSV